MTENLAPESRIRFSRVVTATWVILVSVLAILNCVVLSHVSADKSKTNGDRVVFSALQERVATIEQALEAAKQTPKPVIEASLIAVQEALEDRMTRVSQLAEDAVPRNDLNPLRDRLSAIEARLEDLKHARAAALARSRAAASTQPMATELPFTVLSTELRGGERFLAVAPAGAHSLGQVHVLGVGDVEDNWRLETLDGKATSFRSEGHVQRVDVP